MPLRPLLFSFLLASLVVAASPAPSAPAERSRLIVRGRVLDESGRPIRDAWVVAKGSRRAASLVDTAGAYVLTVPGATVAEMTRAPVRIRLQARRRAWRIGLANGSPELGIEMRVVADSGGAAKLLVRSNDPVVAALVANAAVLEASPQMILEVNFAGAPGIQEETEVTELSATQRVTLYGATSGDTASTAAKNPAPTVMPKPSPVPAAPAAPPTVTPRPLPVPAASAPPPSAGSGDSAGRRLSSTPTDSGQSPPSALSRDQTTPPSVTQVGVGPLSASRAPATATEPRPNGRGADPCRCEIRGIVEIDSERPLQETMRVILYLEDEPAARDTVELFMGSPRDFHLGRASCGRHRVAFTTRSKQRYRLTSLEPVVDCTGGGTRSVKLVLAPVGRGLSFR